MNNSKQSTKITLLLFVLFVLVNFLIMPIIQGVAFTYLWQWYISKIFDIRPITFFEALGILITLRFIFIRNLQDDKSLSVKEYSSEVYLPNVATSFFKMLYCHTIYTFFVLVIGWAINLFIA